MIFGPVKHTPPNSIHDYRRIVRSPLALAYICYSYISITWWIWWFTILKTRIDEDKLDPMKRMVEKDRLAWEDERRKLCGRLLENCNIRLLDIGRNNTGSGLVGKFYSNSKFLNYNIAFLILSESLHWAYMMLHHPSY